MKVTARSGMAEGSSGCTWFRWNTYDEMDDRICWKELEAVDMYVGEGHGVEHLFI